MNSYSLSINSKLSMNTSGKTMGFFTFFASFVYRWLIKHCFGLTGAASKDLAAEVQSC